jgi:hypothetical protein
MIVFSGIQELCWTMEILKQRLLEKIVKDSSTGCWNWTASKNLQGYGRIWANGKTRFAHRLSYELNREPSLPGSAGLNVCHRCDNPSCINPSHLFLGTAAENSSDMTAKNRQARGEAITKNRFHPAGSAHGRAKLTDADVLAIRAIEGMSVRKIAKRYGVGPSQICRIRLGKNWLSDT